MISLSDGTTLTIKETEAHKFRTRPLKTIDRLCAHLFVREIHAAHGINPSFNDASETHFKHTIYVCWSGEPFK